MQRGGLAGDPLPPRHRGAPLAVAALALVSVHAERGVHVTEKAVWSSTSHHHHNRHSIKTVSLASSQL